MKKIIFYTYSKCSTCRKASKWLDQNCLEHKSIDIVNEPPSVKYLKIALKQYSDNIKKIFNTRGNSFKSIDFDIFSLSNEEIIRLLLSDGKLIKRPFVVNGESVVVLGFNEMEYANQFL